MSIDDKYFSRSMRHNSRSILQRSKTLSIPRPRLKRQKNIHFESRPPLLVVSSSQSSLNQHISDIKEKPGINNQNIKCLDRNSLEKKYNKLLTCCSCIKSQSQLLPVPTNTPDRHDSLPPSDNELSSFEDIPINGDNMSQSFESCHLLNVPSITSLLVDTKNRRDSYGNKPSYPTAEEIQSCRSRCRKITLNVGGVIFQTLWRTLDYLPNTRLGKLSRCESHHDLMELCDGYNLENAEFYFDRNATSFGCILDFYRTGLLHMSDLTCVMTFSDDLQYWCINDVFIYSCCLSKYHHRKELMLEEIRKEAHALENKTLVENFSPNYIGQCRKKLWYVLDKPNTSRLAKVTAIVSVLFILLSTIGLTINTLPQLQVNVTESHNHSPIQNYPKRVGDPNELAYTHQILKDNPSLEMIE